MNATPKVSVVVAVYQPGEAFDRVIRSLDAQTMPPDEFEVILVDDGSADDTYQRLQEVARTRPHMKAVQIEHSGWPSRPRNVGIERARGEYILFMDHDDSLYPDALRRAHEYASQNRSDVLAIKESKTNDVWWGMPALDEGNLGNAAGHGGIDRLQPMMPHKFYRRSLLVDHGIRFPEGERMLWEDVFINVGAYRHADVVSVLADTPVYLWHASDINSSHTFDPARLDFWDRIEDVLNYIRDTLDGPEHVSARDAVLAWEVGYRIIHRCVLLVSRPQENEHAVRARGLRRARHLLDRFASDAVYQLLPRRQRMMLHLIREQDMARIKALRRFELGLAGQTRADRVSWRDGSLCFTTSTRWGPKGQGHQVFRRLGDRVLLDLDSDLQAALPGELLDVTNVAATMRAQLAVRARRASVTWKLPHEVETAVFDTDDDGALSLLQRGTGRVDLDTAAWDRPLDEDVWDLRLNTDWLGMERRAPLEYRGGPVPALLHGRAAVAYSNSLSGLSLDLAQRLRTFAIDASPRAGSAGTTDSFSVPLDNASVFGQGVLEVHTLAAIDESGLPADRTRSEGAEAIEKQAATGRISARVVGEEPGARLEGDVSLRPGDYAIYARREGRWHRTGRTLRVDAGRQIELG